MVYGMKMTMRILQKMNKINSRNMSIGPIGALYAVLEENIDSLMNTNKKDRGLTEPGFKAKRAKAYSKIVKVIMSCERENQLETAGKMIENYERLMLNFYLTSHLTKKETKQSAIDLLSLIKLKRKQIRRK